MIFGLIFILAIVVILAFFVGKNLDNTTAIWFFKSFENKNVVVIVFVAFAAGIIFSLICYMIGKVLKENQIVEPQKKTRAEKKLEKEQAAAKLASEKAAVKAAKMAAKTEKMASKESAKTPVEIKENNSDKK